ncbi:MAG: Hsp70 family protein, partial [Syntrophobacteraceae bacterium]|nr:Hsp70 family protein [Syntrophobacteraceae bacterium]
GVETLGGVMTRLIERNTTIPARREEVFSTAEDNQTAVDIVVLQGEREMAKDNRVLGKFRLEGIRPAPRGLPQVQVVFDIDANGILNVKARDQETGKEQTVTISESTNLPKDEVERMVRDAREHAADDKARREVIEARNHADSLAYQLERTIMDLADKVPVHEKARCERLVEDARRAVKDEGVGKDRYQQLASDLQQALQMVASAAYRQAETGAEAGSDAYPGGARSRGGEDVIDAEFTER